MPPPLPDYPRPGLEVAFVGIDPSLLSARRGHDFADPCNDVRRILHGAGLTSRRS